MSSAAWAKVMLERGLVPAFWLVACARARAPLPPDATIYRTDEARDAFDMRIPRDAAHVSVPAWASLEEVWGTYDPPFMNALNGPKTVVFGDDDRSLVILGSRGEVRVWDRAQHETSWRSDACRGGAPTPETERPDEAQLYLSSGALAAIGFRSGFFCVMDPRTGSKVVDMQAHDMRSGGSTTLLARLVGSRLVTYAYRSPETYVRGDGSSTNVEAAGGDLRTWDARTGRMRSTVHVGGFAGAALSPDGTHFAAVDGAGLHLFEVTGRALWSKREKLHQLSFATNDHLLALRGTALVDVDVKDGEVRPFPPGYFASVDEAPYRGVVPSRDGRYVLTVLEYGRFELWDVAARAEVTHGVLQWSRIDGWSGSPTGALFVAPGAAVVNAKTLALIEQPKGAVRFVALSGSGERALGSRDVPPRAVQLWDATARTVAEWENRNEGYLELTSDGTRVLVRESELNKLREVATGRVIVDAPGHIWTPAALSPDGTRMAHLLWDAHRNAYDTLLRDTHTGAILWRNMLEKPDRILAFDASGQRLVFSDYDNHVTFLSSQNGAVLARLGPVPALKELHLGDDFALVDDAKGLAVVELASWTPRFRIVQRTFPRGVALARNAPYFWEFDGALVRRRSLMTGEPIGDPIDLSPSDDEARAIATSSDGKILIVGTERGVLLRFRMAG